MVIQEKNIPQFFPGSSMLKRHFMNIMVTFDGLESFGQKSHSLKCLKEIFPNMH